MTRDNKGSLDIPGNWLSRLNKFKKIERNAHFWKQMRNMVLKIFTFHRISPVHVVIKGIFDLLFESIASLRSKEFAGVMLLQNLHWSPTITYTTFQPNSFTFAFNMFPHKFGRPFSRCWMVEHARQAYITCCTQAVIELLSESCWVYSKRPLSVL